MKPKTKSYADKLLANPKMSQTEAYLQTHKTTNPNTARVNASKLMANANVQLYLDKHIKKARDKVVQLIDSKNEQTALRASDSVLDRQLGKPRQQIEVSSQMVSINIDLTSPDSE